MATIGQIRGAILEETVLYLLNKVGYKIVRYPCDSINASDLAINSSGLELRGRGTWHQIDAIAEQHHTPAFTYPLRLLVEAKFYTKKKVGIEIVRNSVGVHKDLTENHFSDKGLYNNYSSIRFNYQSAIFSVSGYTERAISYAIAHQIFLIEYKKIPIIKPVIDGIASLELTSFTPDGQGNLTGIRGAFRKLLASGEINSGLFSSDGIEKINQNVITPIHEIRGSYFGMLQGRWPLHLLTSRPLPPSMFENDIVKCELRGDSNGQWRFIPTGINPGSVDWFELQFNLPPELTELISKKSGDRVAIAMAKSENFSYIALSGVIGNIWRNVRVELDNDWLIEYLR